MKQVIGTFLAIFLSVQILTAQVRLPKYISDGMVLQRDQPIKIWGYASPLEKISLIINGNVYVSTASRDSLWTVNLPPQKAGGPFKIIIQAINYVVIDNVLFGDVWVCSGQSNMELPMERLKDAYPEIYRSASNPMIRQFMVPKQYDFNQEREDFTDGQWTEVSPKTIKDFSGVAYFFANKIYENEKIPIGLINTALGGSPAQSWISEEGLKKFPEYLQTAHQYRDQKYVDSISNYNANRHRNWYGKVNQIDLGLQENWVATTTDRSDWKSANMPALWRTFDPSIKPGAIWMSRSFSVPKKYAGQSARLFLGCIVDADSVYINGQFVGTTSYQYPPRKYEIPTALLNEGMNEITIRVIDENGRGGFVKDKPYEIEFKDKTKIELGGDWQYKIGCETDAIQPHVFIQWKPVGLYNAMIHPLFHYAVKGALWYQGESNVGKYFEYFDLMKQLISDWRTGWNNQKLPFYYVQLSNFLEAKPMPIESYWAGLRQQQLELLQLPNTGMAVTIDIGEWNDIHPLNKKDVGERLALHALKNDYGKKDLIVSGPIVKNYTIDNNIVRLDFDYVKNGIRKVNELKYFELAGEDKKFYNAKATIKNKSIILQCDQVASPKYVRYAWADNPEGVNFFNKDGIPASPFELKFNF